MFVFSQLEPAHQSRCNLALSTGPCRARLVKLSNNLSLTVSAIETIRCLSSRFKPINQPTYVAFLGGRRGGDKRKQNSTKSSKHWRRLPTTELWTTACSLTATALDDNRKSGQKSTRCNSLLLCGRCLPGTRLVRLLQALTQFGWEAVEALFAHWLQIEFVEFRLLRHLRVAHGASEVVHAPRLVQRRKHCARNNKHN